MENEQYIESGLSVGTTKIANKYEIFTEEEVDIINNKIPELDERVSIIEYEIEDINSSLDSIVQDDLISSSSTWSSEKVKEQISLIPKGDKGDKGDPGTASVAIDDTKINSSQTWTSNKIFNEIENLTLSSFNNNILYDDVFTKITTTTNNGGQIILLYDLGTITNDTLFTFDSNIYSEYSLGDMYINVFGNNSSTVTDLSGGYSITIINPKTHKTGSVMSLNANFTAKANYRYLRVLIRFQGINPTLYIHEKIKDVNNSTFSIVGIGGFNVAINSTEANTSINKQLITKENIEKNMYKTAYFENKFLAEKNMSQVYESAELKIISNLNKTWHTIVFDMQKEDVDLNKISNLEVDFTGSIISDIIANNYIVNVYASGNANANDLETDTIVIQQTSLTNNIENGNFIFNKLYEKRNLQGKRYLKLLVTTNFEKTLNSAVNIALKDLKLKVNNIPFYLYDCDVYRFNGTNGVSVKKINNNEFVRYKDLTNVSEFNFWENKIWMQFGDSITWQDKHTWGYYDKVGEIARGYQTVVGEILKIGGSINNGRSDTTLANVNAGRGSMWKAFFENGCPDLTGVDLITIAHGTNDYASNVVIGEIGNIDDITFDNTTYYGAYRDILTKIITNYPNIRIVLCTPIQKATKILPNSAGHVLLDYANAIRKIGEMYGLPVCDFYSNSGLNYLNHATYYPDKVHPNELGHLQMGRYLANVLRSC